jgi:hypothetical protein
MGDYIIKSHRGEQVPADSVSRLIKATKNTLKNPSNLPGSDLHKSYQAQFK